VKSIPDLQSIKRHAPGRKLAVRLGLRLCLGAAVVFILAGIWSLAGSRSQMTEILATSADRSVETIRRSTRDAMLRNKPEEVRAIIRSIGGQPGIERIRIFDKLGRITVSSDPAEEGSEIDKQAEQCYACHRVDRPLTALDRPDRMRTFGTNGERLLAVISPIRNEEACYTCHEPEHTVLGVLDVQLSMGVVDAHVATNERNFAIGLGLAMLLLLLMAGVLVWQLVLRRVHMLTVASHAVGAGDLEVQVPVGVPDEIGALAAQWNSMVSELRRAHRELATWSRTLEQRVDDKTRELEGAHKRMLLVEKMASLGKLAAVVAHEINNPLAGIGTYARLLRKKIARREEGGAANPEDSESDRILAMVEEEAARCGRIVRNLLLFARSPGARFQCEDLRPMLERCVMLVQHKADLQEVEIRLEIAPDLPQVECDASQLQQVVIVLAMNAIEAMPSGGALVLRARPASGGGEVRLEVTDSGVGIEPEQLTHVFEPFFTTKEQGQGVGLGLAVAYGIVGRHHGQIEVDSTPGIGTTFTIRLPARQPAGESGTPEGTDDAQGSAPPATPSGSEEQR